MVDVLGGAEKDLWGKMCRDAVSLPFHARPEIWRSNAGKYMSCRGKEEKDPFTLIKNLLTDGRAVYCVYFEKSELTPEGLGVHPAVCYLNLPLTEEEKRRRDNFGPRRDGLTVISSRRRDARERVNGRSSVQPEGGPGLSREWRDSMENLTAEKGSRMRGVRPCLSRGTL